MMYCTCNERHQWFSNEHNLSSSATLPRKSYETLTPTTTKKSALKTTNARYTAIVPAKKCVKTVDSHLGPRFSTLPRTRSRTKSHVATIFNTEQSDPRRQRRQSEVIPWHQHQAPQCTCKSSCYFCNLNYPLSASANALGYYYPYSTQALNNPNFYQQQSTPSNQYLHNTSSSYQLPAQHRHSMINLNHNYTPNPIETVTCEPSAVVNRSASPTMSESPIPAAPAPPLNPSCARCRFTSSISATSNGTLHRQPAGSNSHIHASLSHQNSNYGMPPAVAPVPTGNSYAGELFSLNSFLTFSQKLFFLIYCFESD